MIKKGLGNGLNALFAEKPVLETKTSTERIDLLKLEDIRPNPNQPRQFFDDSALQELVDSVKEQGVLLPILVRPQGDKSYEIVAGERRYRAAKLAGLKEIPAIVRIMDDTSTLEVALIENIQRQNLNSLEEAISYKELMHSYGYTQAKLAEKLGKSRVYIANTIRLLGLPQPVQEAIVSGALSAGHGKAILQLSKEKDRLALGEKVILENLSVRQTEEIAKNPQKIALTTTKQDIKPEKNNTTKPTTVDDLVVLEMVEKLRSKLGTKVAIKKTGNLQGKIILEYYNSEDLDRILTTLLPEEEF